MPSPQPLPLSFGEYRPDISDHNATYTSQLLNVKPRADGYGPLQDVQGYTQALPAACRGYFYARNGDGSVAIFAATSNRLYLMNNTDFSWTDKSDGGAAYTALSSTAQWQFAQFNNFVFATQANEVVQVFDLTTPSNTFEDLAGSPPQAAYIAIVNRFVVLSGLLSQPYRIQWSGLNATTTWTAGTNFSDFQDLPDGGQNRGVVGGEYGLILQEGAIRRMIYAPGSELVFQIDRVAQDRGLNAPYSLVAAGEKVFFLTAQGFVQSDASGILNPIGKERVDRYFFADYDSSSPQLMIGVADPSTNIVIWVYRSNSGSAGLFDKGLLFDWVLNRWAPFRITGEYIASLARPGLTLESLDAISGSLDDLPFSLDDVTSATLPRLSAATGSHTIGFFTGSNLEATLETSEYSIPGRVMDINGCTPLTDAPSVFASVGLRASLGKNVPSVYTAEAEMTLDGFCPALAEGRYTRMRLRIPAATDWDYAKGLIPEARAAGKA